MHFLFNRKRKVNVEAPSPDENPLDKGVEGSLNGELLQLSSKDRIEVLNDVHGIEDVIPEDPASVEASIQELNQRLDEFWSTSSQAATNAEVKSTTAAPSSSSNSSALFQVMVDSPGYVRAVSFQLMFLRADRWKVDLAFQRMASFFEQKRCLFGRTFLSKDITLDQLDDDDMETLKSGYAQILPRRDRAGRAILLTLTHLRSGRKLRSIVSEPGFSLSVV